MSTAVRILLVDDEPANRLAVRAILEDVDVEIVEAGSGEEALVHLLEGDFGLLLLDVRMPGIDGFDTARIVRSRTRTRRVPIIFLSALGQTEQRSAGYRTGAVDYIEKPFDPVVLCSKVEVFIELDRSRRERERLLRRVEAQNAHLAAILENLPAGVVVAEAPSERIGLANERAERILGFPIGRPDGLAGLGQLDAERLDGTPYRADDWPLVRSLRTGEVVPGEEIATRTASGERRRIQVRSAPITDGEGRIVAAVAIFDDTTEIRALEAQLLQSQKMDAVGRLAGGVAHDFNNLLTVILGSCQFATAIASEEVRLELEEIHKAAQRAAGLTRQLLAFGRKEVSRPEPLGLPEVVANMERMLRRVIGEDVELSVAEDPGAPPVLVDPVQIEQVLVNLVVNARDAMPGGGRIEIRTGAIDLDDEAAAALDGGATAGPHARLSVADDGSGMSLETQRQIFEPFFTTKPRGQGTGLGLSTVYGIVQAAGGTVGVESRVGRGTTFSVYLPACQAGQPPDEAGEERPAPVAAGPERILVVEDERGVRRLVERVLTRAGYEVEATGDPRQALARLAEGAPSIDLVLSDIVMPHMSGTELRDRTLSVRPGQRFLFMSGYNEEATLARGHDLELPLLPKPFGPDDVLRAVRAAIEGPAA